MFKKLFTPKNIGNCEIKNRLVVTAMVTNYCNADGTATERYIAYHEEKAKGGWGLIITEDYAVNEHAMGYQYIAGLWNDGQIEGHRRLTERVHAHGTKIFAQIYHAGRQSCSAVNGGMQPVAPSAIPCPWLRQLPRELSVPEIHQIVDDFANCALRAKKSGFDGIEIHAAHGYLIAEFLSPYANKRTDQYGGCLVNRMRFLREIYTAVREKVGNEFPVTIRFSADEAVQGGRDISETRVIAKMFEEMGFDALHVSSGVYGDHNKGIVSAMYTEHAWTVKFAEEVKKIVDIPVITVNRINDPYMAESILDLNKADFIGMGRGSLADPYLPVKAQAGDLENIRYCVGCLQGCTGKLLAGEPVTCLVNPSVGREYELDYRKTDMAKKVMVVGGGPGGLEAARAAAMKGHEVSLYEKKSHLGGQFRSAAYPPCKGELSTYIAWLSMQMQELGVTVYMDTEVTEDLVKEEKPDVVIVAAGGTPIVPPIKGIDGKHVKFAEDVLVGNVETGDRIVVAGGGEVGGETAAHLAMQQRKVTIVEMQPEILKELDGVSKIALKKILDEYDVDQYVNSKVIEIAEDGILIENEGEIVKIPADTVVLALGYKPERQLAENIKRIHDHVIVIGGAVKTSNALVAVREGFDAGMKLS